MSKFVVEIKDDQAYLTTPYNPVYVQRIKQIGARWDASSKRWRINAQSVDVARKIMREIYGEDDQEQNEKVTVIATFAAERSALCSAYCLLGKVIARAYGRDSGAQVGPDAAFAAGAPQSGGSVKNWRTVIPAGSVVEIYNVPLQFAEQEIKRNKSQDDKIEFEIKKGSCKIDREALAAERERLLLRISEIDQILKSQKEKSGDCSPDFPLA